MSEPVREVVSHVVAAERQHGEGVAPQVAHRAGLGGRGLRRHDGAEEHAVLPVVRLEDKRDDAGAAAAEEDGADRHAGRVLPLGGDSRVLGGRGGEAGIGMRGGRARFGRPVVALPVGQVSRRRVGHALPPDVTVVGQRGVGEDAVAGEGEDGVGVGVGVGAGRHTEEAGLGVDGVEAAVGTELHPADVVTDRLDLPAVDGRDEHGQVGLAARRREGAGDIADVAFGGGELQDEHVLGHPAGVACHDRRDA